MEGWGCCCLTPFAIAFLGLLLAVAAAIPVGIERAISVRRGIDRMGPVGLIAVALSAFVLWCVMILLLAMVVKAATGKCLEAPYLDPPQSFQDSDLVGTWEANYWGSIDRLTFRPNGTFRQVYVDDDVEDYVYETPWNECRVHRFGDGRVRLHLPGARYYVEGIRIAEQDGRYWGSRFRDPIAHEWLDMEGQLVLNVRVDSSGELLLFHMWSTGDEGYAMFGCEVDTFRRVETP